MNKKANGFTLSEVLITLGVIGVVAAMTLPSVIGNYRKHVVENNLKKYYTMLNQVLTNSEAENGPAANWEWSAYARAMNRNEAHDFFDKYFAPYFKIIDEKSTFSPDPFIPKTSEGQKRQVAPEASNWRILSDGGVITFGAYNFVGNLGSFYVILPNANKNNLMYGRDVFSFNIRYKKVSNATNNSMTINNNQVIVEPTDNNGCSDIESNRNTFINVCANSNNSPTTASSCTRLIYCNNWKIPKDYPIRF